MVLCANQHWKVPSTCPPVCISHTALMDRLLLLQIILVLYFRADQMKIPAHRTCVITDAVGSSSQINRCTVSDMAVQHPGPLAARTAEVMKQLVDNSGMHPTMPSIDNFFRYPYSTNAASFMSSSNVTNIISGNVSG